MSEMEIYSAPKTSAVSLLRKESGMVAREVRGLIRVFQRERIVESKDLDVSGFTGKGEPIRLWGKSFFTNKGLKTLSVDVSFGVQNEGLTHGSTGLTVCIDSKTNTGKMYETDFIFAIPEEKRGRGVGSAMMDYALRWAFEEGAKKVTFSTHQRFATRLQNNFGAEIHESSEERTAHPNGEPVFWNVTFTKESLSSTRRYFNQGPQIGPT